MDMGIPDASYPRYDVLAIRFSANENATAIAVIQGTPSSSPTIPAITRTEAVYELYICAVLREVGATSITAKDITDLRLNPAYCGLMADSVTKVDTTAIEAQTTALIDQLRGEIAAVKAGSAYVLKSGDAMTGNLSVPAPTQSGHAANKGYVDTKTISATLAAASWEGAAAPYTQTITVAGLTDEMNAEAHPVYSGTLETDLALREACDCVSYATYSGDQATFCCLEEKPAVDIPIEVRARV